MHTYVHTKRRYPLQALRAFYCRAVGGSLGPSAVSRVSHLSPEPIPQRQHKCKGKCKQGAHRTVPIYNFKLIYFNFTTVSILPWHNIHRHFSLFKDSRTTRQIVIMLQNKLGFAFAKQVQSLKRSQTAFQLEKPQVVCGKVASHPVTLSDCRRDMIFWSTFSWEDIYSDGKCNCISHTCWQTVWKVWVFMLFLIFLSRSQTFSTSKEINDIQGNQTEITTP